MRDLVAKQVEKQMEQILRRRKIEDEKILRKLDLFSRRGAKIVKVMAKGQILSRNQTDEQNQLHYQVHWKYVIHQSGKFYIEEEIEKREAQCCNQMIIEDKEIYIPFKDDSPPVLASDFQSSYRRAPYRYNRLAAVRYAERWWNDYNPAFEKFEVDCTNYVSQCLLAGGAPMRGYPNRTRGWWYQNRKWSFSWSVANALKIYLATSTTGLRAKEVKDARELQLGDIICYDFQGDGRYDHNTIVTGKDANGEPLVNAHTYNSRMRYWKYEDSTAYTPNIQYKLYTIIDDS